MKICFINPPFKPEFGKFSRESRSPSIGHSGVLYYPLWLIYAAAAAREAGFDVAFIDAPAKRMTAEQVLHRICECAGDARLFVFDTSTPSIQSDMDFAAAVKERYPSAFTLLVGTHPSALPEETLRCSSGIDGIARREYDFIVRDLALALKGGRPLEDVRGLSFWKNGSILHNPDADFIADPDQLPWVSKFIREYLDVRDYVFPAAAHPAIQLFTGRGCPARCNFCVYPQVLHGRKYRVRSIGDVIAEMEYICDSFPDVREIVFEDDTFTIDRGRVNQLCRAMIGRGLHKRLRWLCNARVELDFETMRLMKQAGCHLIVLGIESMDQQILNNIRKGTTAAQIERCIADARRAGLMVHACYMVGNPGETRETMKKTLRAALRFHTDTAQFFPLTPYPGTCAYAWAQKSGFLRGGYGDYLQADGTLNCILERPDLPARELVDFCAHARKKYYLRPRYIVHRLWRGLLDFQDLKRSLKAFARLRRTLFR